MREPLTEEQLNQIGAETSHAVNKALSIYSRRATAGFCILLVALGAGFVRDRNEREDRRSDNIEARQTIVDSGNSVAVSGCNRDFVHAQRIQGIFRLFRLPVELFPLPDCRISQHAVTDNIDRNVNSPEPFYPGSPNAPTPPKLTLPQAIGRGGE